jgi:hypothetical protein
MGATHRTTPDTGRRCEGAGSSRNRVDALRRPWPSCWRTSSSRSLEPRCSATPFCSSCASSVVPQAECRSASFNGSSCGGATPTADRGSCSPSSVLSARGRSPWRLPPCCSCRPPGSARSARFWPSRLRLQSSDGPSRECCAAGVPAVDSGCSQARSGGEDSSPPRSFEIRLCQPSINSPAGSSAESRACGRQHGRRDTAGRGRRGRHYRHRVGGNIAANARGGLT